MSPQSNNDTGKGQRKRGQDSNLFLFGQGLEISKMY
jgi:hypothetical protein